MQNSSCKRCALSAGTKTVCVWGTGPADAQIMLVGEAPGADEERNGQPFVGAAGRVLNQALAEAGIARESLYITNAVKCRPPANRTPVVAEQDACLTYLLEEIEAVKPAIVVALGNTSLRTLTGRKTGITVERGKLLPVRKGIHMDSQLMATFHPSAELHKPGSVYHHIVSDLRLAKSLISPSHERTGDVIYWALPNAEDVIEKLYEFDDATTLTCDLEWTASKERMIWPWSRAGEIYSISLTGRVQGQLISVALGWPLAPAVREEVVKLLQSRNVVFHNAAADALWLAHERIPVKISGDTMILAYLLDELKRVSLTEATARYAPDVEPGWKGHLFTSKPSTEAQWEEILTYNATDTAATYKLMEGEMRAIRASGRADQILRLHKHLMLPALKVLTKAAYYGVPLDEAELKRQHAMAIERQREAMERLAEHASVTPKQAAALAASSDQTTGLVESLGIKLTTSRKQELQDLTEYPAVQAVLDYRKEAKLLSTYLGPWLEMLKQQGDGRLHSVYRLTSTYTGRLSTESERGGALQVTPREAWVRALIRATPGRQILSADYGTVEMRIAAWFANERAMLAIFDDPESDIHRATAAYMVACRGGVMPFEVYWPQRAQWEAQVGKKSEERQSAKGVNFGLIFYMQPDKLRAYVWQQYRVRMTQQEAEQAHAAYFRLYADLPAWHEACMKQAQTVGFTETPFGRRRAIESEDVTKAINTPVQSTASDLTLLAMSQTDAAYREARLDARIVGFVHDSILVDVHEQHADAAATILQYTMEQVDTSVFGFKVPVRLPVEVKLGETWG